MLFQRLR